MAEYKIDTSELREYCGRLRAGDRVLLSGAVYTSRDAAHKRICALLDSGEELPFDLKDAAIYYAGPTPTKPGDVIGSCGPTTSSRIGGAGALASKCITKCEEIAFFDLGCESVKHLEFKDFPLTVGIDSYGGTMFEK